MAFNSEYVHFGRLPPSNASADKLPVGVAILQRKTHGLVYISSTIMVISYVVI